MGLLNRETSIGYYTWESHYTGGCLNSAVSVISIWQEKTIFQCYKPIIKRKESSFWKRHFWCSTECFIFSSFQQCCFVQQKQILSDRKVHFPLCPAAHSVTVQSIVKSEMGKKTQPKLDSAVNDECHTKMYVLVWPQASEKGKKDP